MEDTKCPYTDEEKANIIKGLSRSKSCVNIKDPLYCDICHRYGVSAEIDWLVKKFACLLCARELMSNISNLAQEPDEIYILYRYENSMIRAIVDNFIKD